MNVLQAKAKALALFKRTDLKLVRVGDTCRVMGPEGVLGSGTGWLAALRATALRLSGTCDVKELAEVVKAEIDAHTKGGR